MTPQTAHFDNALRVLFGYRSGVIRKKGGFCGEDAKKGGRKLQILFCKNKFVRLNDLPFYKTPWH